MMRISKRRPFKNKIVLTGKWNSCKLNLFPFCSEPQAMCYIETSNLDGETNLKIRQVLEVFIETFICVFFLCNKNNKNSLSKSFLTFLIGFVTPGSLPHSRPSDRGGFDGAVWSFGVRGTQQTPIWLHWHAAAREPKVSLKLRVFSSICPARIDNQLVLVFL